MQVYKARGIFPSLFLRQIAKPDEARKRLAGFYILSRSYKLSLSLTSLWHEKGFKPNSYKTSFIAITS